MSTSDSALTRSICSVEFRSLKDKALEEFFATEEARRSVQISLVAEVASDYLTLAADIERLKNSSGHVLRASSLHTTLSRAALKPEPPRNLISVRHRQLWIRPGWILLASQARLAQDENALALVLGSPVPADLLPSGLSAITALKELSAGLPSDVLQRRPDIVQAEHLLKAANANIGAARAAFFPSITLTTSIGASSVQLSGLFKGGTAVAWSFAPQITLPIFDAGRNRANLKVTEVDREIFLSQYEKAIQGAF